MISAWTHLIFFKMKLWLLAADSTGSRLKFGIAFLSLISLKFHFCKIDNYGLHFGSTAGLTGLICHLKQGSGKRLQNSKRVCVWVCLSVCDIWANLIESARIEDLSDPEIPFIIYLSNSANKTSFILTINIITRWDESVDSHTNIFVWWMGHIKELGFPLVCWSFVLLGGRWMCGRE